MISIIKAVCYSNKNIRKFELLVVIKIERVLERKNMMKKRLSKLCLVSLIIMSCCTGVFAASKTTEKIGSVTWNKQVYSVKARANWVYETGEYSSRGNHTVIQKPNSTLLNYYGINFMNEVSSKYEVKQYFQPVTRNYLSGFTSNGPVIGIVLKSPGAY